MKAQPFVIFRRIYVLVFVSLAALGLLFVWITYLATTNFYEASTQLLNKDVAAHIARFTSPYGAQGFDRKKADSVFQEAMVLSPSAEVYFLDTTGTVIYYHGASAEIQRWQIPLEHIQRYIQAGGTEHINGPDPRDPSQSKIFSAAAVDGPSGKLGYIYVILGSRQYRSVTQMLYNSHATPLVITSFTVVLLISLCITLLYIQRIRLRFNDVMAVLYRFRRGDFTARFTLRAADDLGPLTESFNNLADLLLENINQLTASEKVRKDFMVNISHDLRTPLAIARGYSETLLLKKGQLDTEQEKAYAELVVNKIRQVENMVNQLFELSKMESASFEAMREPFIFSEVLQEVIRSVGATRLVCDNCTDGAWVEADISMMERVLQNLLVNALAYTPEDGSIRVSLQRNPQGLMCHIQNEGPALRPDLLEWINQSDPSTRPSAIGLTIVRKILILHHFPLTAVVLPGPINAFSFQMPVYAPE
jgi:signal transduction histidine kinase